MKRSLLALTGAALLFSGGIGYAADEKKPEVDKKEVFAKKDKDKDGKLSKDEFKGKKEGEDAAKLEKAFAKLDKDADGYLTLEEFTAVPAKK